MEKNNKPIRRYKAGGISLSVFKNDRKVNGQDVEFHSFQLQRAYKDRDGQWQNTSSMGINDLPKAELLLNKAYEDAVLKDGNAISDEVVVEKVS